MKSSHKFDVSRTLNLERKAKLLYLGSKCNYKFDPYIEACKGKSPTICFIKTKNDKVFGAYTTQKWGSDGISTQSKDQGFVFKFNQNKMEVFKGNVINNSFQHLFCMGHSNSLGPFIRQDGTADAYLSEWYSRGKKLDRDLILCDERYPDLAEVEIW